MKTALFVSSFVLLVGASIFYIFITNTKNSSQTYWGKTTNSENGIWLSKENKNIVGYRIKEDVKGYFSGNAQSKSSDYLIDVRLTDDVDKTDYTVSIPRKYNLDQIKLTPEDIVKTFTNPGIGVVSIITYSNIGYTEYLHSIFLPPTQ